MVRKRISFQPNNCSSTHEKSEWLEELVWRGNSPLPEVGKAVKLTLDLLIHAQDLREAPGDSIGAKPAPDGDANRSRK